MLLNFDHWQQFGAIKRMINQTIEFQSYSVIV